MDELLNTYSKTKGRDKKKFESLLVSKMEVMLLFEEYTRIKCDIRIQTSHETTQKRKKQCDEKKKEFMNRRDEWMKAATAAIENLQA